MRLASIIIILSFIVYGIAMGAADKSLLLYLTFDSDDGKTAKDLSMYNNNGIIRGNPKKVEGIFGFAWELNGTTDTIEVPHSDSLNIEKSITMQMWVRLLAGGKSDNQAGIEKGGWEAGEYSLYAFYVPGNASAVQFKDLPESCGDANSGNLGKDLRDDKWHHLAGVWDGKKIFLYTDGVLVMSVDCSGSLGTNNKSVFIGSRNGTERFLQGAVDEIRLYNRALSEAEIKKDMNTFGKISVSPLKNLTVCWGDVKKKF